MNKVFITHMDSSLNYGTRLSAASDTLESIVGKKKLVGADILTKTSRYLALNVNEYLDCDRDRLGLIYATEYGNLNSMVELSTLARSSAEEISTRVFPNATICSASVATSLLLQARGLNITLNSGFFSYGAALEIAFMQIVSGVLDACIILSGDDYNELAIIDIKKAVPGIKDVLSNVTITVLSNQPPAKTSGRKIFSLEKIELKPAQDSAQQLPYCGRYYRSSIADKLAGKASRLNEDNIYAGSSFPFFVLKDCLDADSAAITFDLAWGIAADKEYEVTIKKEDSA